MPSPKIDALLAFAILLRDRAACVYCGVSKTDGAHITVDHLRPRAWGGKDVPENLVACCIDCNTLKGTADHLAFADMLARYSMTTPDLRRRYGMRGPGNVLPYIDAQIALPIDRIRAAEILDEERRERRAARRKG